jgi:hypothetical protein
MKIEYDRLQPDAELNECWAECEKLWDALLPFVDVGRVVEHDIVQKMDEIIRTLERAVQTLREKAADYT